jgi:hypothetical protein
MPGRVRPEHPVRDKFHLSVSTGLISTSEGVGVGMLGDNRFEREQKSNMGSDETNAG